MKKARKLGLQSLALVLMAFTLVAAVAFGATNAWFTDKEVVTPNNINLGKNVSATLTASYGTPTQDSAHQLGANGAYQYLPGDTITFSGKIAPAATSTSFFARVRVTKLAATTADITFTSITVGSETVNVNDTADGAWTYLETEFIASVDRTFTGNIIINGAENNNNKAEAAIAVKIEVDMIQSANITVDKTNSAWKNNSTTIAESYILDLNA